MDFNCKIFQCLNYEGFYCGRKNTVNTKEEILDFIFMKRLLNSLKVNFTSGFSQ